MLFRFCNVCCKNFDSFTNFPRHYARVLAKNQRLQESNDNEKTAEKGKPIIACKKNTFNFYQGQSYSRKEKILLASSGWNNRKSKGDHIFIFPSDVDDEKEESRMLSHERFEDFKLDPSICDSLASLDIKKPVEIQDLGIPTIFSGYNTVLAAETGCGKTLTYLLPLVAQILQWKEIVQRPLNCPLGLIVAPTRELAVQIGLELINISKHLGVRTKLITGGKTKKIMMDPPVDNVDVLVGSFGVLSKLNTVGVYTLDYVRYVVLDEADALFHNTFEEKLRVFMGRLPIGVQQQVDETGFPKLAQLILASATIPSRINSVLSNVVDVDSLQYVQTEKLHKVLVPQKFIRLGSSDKTTELLKYIKPKTTNRERVIVFSNTSRSSYWLTIFLNECGIPTTNLNGMMPLHVRRGKYGEFLNGKALVLSTTDAGSRGLDTLTVNHILNFDFPLDTSVYIHRCGRTGRMGTTGDCRVTSFICKPSEITLVQKIEMATRKRKPFPLINLVAPPEEEAEAVAEEEAEAEDLSEQEIIESMDEAENIPY